MNRLLKNNFWNGSHVLEWALEDKSDFLPFFEKPPLLQALSEGITEHLPIQLASLSDKLGSLILQVPVTCLVSDYRGTGNAHGGIICDVTWHSDVTPRPLAITAVQWHDGRVNQVSTSIAAGGQVNLPAQDGPAAVRPVIHDQDYDIVLSAMEVNILSAIHLGMHVQHSRKRTFTTKGTASAKSSQVAIDVTSLERSVIGNPNHLAHFDDTRKRIYRGEMQVLRERRKFVQYRPDDKDENGQMLEREERHRRALGDIHYLIKQHGQKAAWLWDPYLDASDVLKTLFYNPHGGSEMRALTGAEQIKEAEKESGTKSGCIAKVLAVLESWRRRDSQTTKKPTKKEQFVITERNFLNQSAGNLEGLRLEFRAKVGDAGFAFHDRFLIFPHADPEPLAWSLGISVNGLGKEHHILQEVPNGRLIADAFQALWDNLNQSEHLVWRTP